MNKSLIVVAIAAGVLTASFANAERARIGFTKERVQDTERTEHPTEVDQAERTKVMAPELNLQTRTQEGLTQAQLRDQKTRVAPSVLGLLTNQRDALQDTVAPKINPVCDTSDMSPAMRKLVNAGLVDKVNVCMINFDQKTRDEIAIPLAQVVEQALGGKTFNEATSEERIAAFKVGIQWLNSHYPQTENETLAQTADRFVELAMVKDPDSHAYKNCVFGAAVNAEIRAAARQLLN